MSKSGAVSKKELAEAGRRKLEEFKRKKQQKAKEADAGAIEPKADSSLAAVPATAAQAADVVHTTVPPPPLLLDPQTASGHTSAATAATPQQQASSSAQQVTAQEPPWRAGLSSSSGDASSQSTAARAAAAGAAAAALEAALMGLPSAAKPATVAHPKPPEAPVAAPALLVQGSHAQTTFHKPEVADVPSTTQPSTIQQGPAAPFGQQFQPQPWQPPTPAGLGNSPGPAARQQTSGQSQQQLPAYEQWQPLQQPWQPAASAAGAPADAAAAAGPSTVWQPESRKPSTPRAEPPAAAGATRSSWLSLFGGRGSSGSQDQQQHYEQQEPQQQQQPQQDQPECGLLDQQEQHTQQLRQHPGQYDSLLLYHHSSQSRQPSSPGHTASSLIPQAGAALPAAAGFSRPPVPWVPGSAAGAIGQTAAATAAGFAKQPWMPGMPDGSTTVTASQGLTAGGNVHSSTAATPPASAGYLSMSDGFLSAAAPQQSAVSSITAAVGGSGDLSATSKQLQQRESMSSGAWSQPRPAAAAAAAAGYASLSDSYLGHMGNGSRSPVKQQQGSNDDKPLGTTQSDSQPPAAAAGLVHELSFGPGNVPAVSAAVQHKVEAPANATVQLGDVSNQQQQQQQRQPADGLLVQQQSQDDQQQQHQLANGNISRPNSYSSFTSAGAASAAAKVGLAENGLQDKVPSAAMGSIAGSGPPSTSGSFSAMSYIQAHAESSSRNAANLKLLQQHIDELTTEKLELMRGLQQQVKANEALADENRALGEQHNGMAAKVESERQAVKRLQGEVEAAAASLAALVGQRDALRAAAQEATDRANTLAAENVSLENQLLELKSSSLRNEKESRDAAAAVARLEAQLALLGSSAGEQGQELQELQAERRILKARLMQAEARMRAAGLEPLPSMPAGMTAADAEAVPGVQKLDAEVQTDLQQQYHLPPDSTAPHHAVLEPAAATVKAAGRQLLHPVVMNEQAAAVLSGLEKWLPQDILAAAEAAIAAGNAAQQQQVVGIAAGNDADAVYNSAMAAAASVLVGGVGVDVWQEEARLASSITGLAAQLEGTWEDMLQQLEQVQARNQELQQSADDLQDQLVDMQQRYEQQQQLLQQLQHQQKPQQQQQQQQQQEQHTNGVQAVAAIKADLQQGPVSIEQPSQQVQPPQQVPERQQQQAVPQLPVSVPAVSAAAEITAAPADDQRQTIPAASSPETAIVNSYDSPAISANSVVGSTSGSAQLWDDGSTASSRGGSKGWFGVWGRRSNHQRSALV